MAVTVNISRRQGLWCATVYPPDHLPQGCWATTVPTAQVRALEWMRDNGFGGERVVWQFKEWISHEQEQEYFRGTVSG